MILLAALAFLSPLEQANEALIRNMFHDVSESKNTAPMPRYFAPDFLLESNNARMGYEELKDHLESAFKVLDSIEVKFRDLIAKEDRIALRATFVGTDSSGKPSETEFIALFEIKEGKIARWQELTYPAW